MRNIQFNKNVKKKKRINYHTHTQKKPLSLYGTELTTFGLRHCGTERQTWPNFKSCTVHISAHVLDTCGKPNPCSPQDSIAL